MRLLQFSAAALILPAPLLAQCTWTLADPLLPGSYATDQYFGRSVALSNGRAAVGAPGFEENIAGKVYVFAEGGNGWELGAELQPAGGLPDDDLGRSVALQDSTILVGAPGHANNGRAVFFEEQGGVWTEAGSFEPPPSDSDGASFGRAVALSGEWAFVGAPGLDRVHVFQKVADAWQPAGTLSPSLHADEFGYSIAVDGDLLAIGAPKEDAVVLFTRTAGGWVENAILAAPPALEAEFGASVALRGTTLAVGAPEVSLESGAAVLYDLYAGTWALTNVLFPDAAGPALFGTAVALGQNRILVGAPAEEQALGAAYVFTRLGSDWSLDAKLMPSLGPIEYNFGTAIGFDAGSETAFVNVGLEEVPVFGQGTYGGAMYVWSEGAQGCPELTAYPAWIESALGGTQNLAFDADPSLAFHLYMVVGAMTGTVPGTELGAVTVPLNIDAYTMLMLNKPNSGPFVSTLGLLDGNGFASASISLSPQPTSSLVGLQLDHAALVIDPATLDVVHASNSTHLEIF